MNDFERNYRSLVWRAEREKWNALFDRIVRYAGIPKPVAEYQFHPTRLWRLDRAWPLDKVGVELEGGIWRPNGGAHSRPENIIRDIEKHNAALLIGWRVFRFASPHLNSPYAMECLTNALKGGLSWTNP